MHACDVGTSDLILDFHLAIESRLDLLDSTAEQVMQLVRQLPCSGSSLDDVELALAEALANAMLHGNRQDANKKVQICGGCERPGQLLLAVTDEGDGFDCGLIPNPTAGDNVLSAHGRGLYLINRLMDHTQFRMGGRQVVMRKRA